MGIKDRYEKGLASMAKHKGSPDEKLLYAIASMLEYKPKQAKKVLPSLGVGPQFVYNTFRAKCSDKLALDGYSTSDFGRLGKHMTMIKPPVTTEDVELVASWINEGGLDYWSMKPTLSHIAKHFGGWLQQAKADRKPAQKRKSPFR